MQALRQVTGVQGEGGIECGLAASRDVWRFVNMAVQGEPGLAFKQEVPNGPAADGASCIQGIQAGVEGRTMEEAHGTPGG